MALYLQGRHIQGSCDSRFRVSVVGVGLKLSSQPALHDKCRIGPFGPPSLSLSSNAVSLEPEATAVMVRRQGGEHYSIIVLQYSENPV